MINLDISSPTSVKQFNEKLLEVENGTHYLRVSDHNGQLSYDTTPKAKDFLGRVIQYITRLFDASYNINRASALLGQVFFQFSFQAMTEIENSVNTLSHIIEHVNECRHIRKIDLSLYFPAIFDTRGNGTINTLKQWITDAPNRGRIEAARRILECQKHRFQYLDLSNLGLTSLPPEIGNLTSVKNLSIHDNQLTSLPAEIGRLTSLRYLDVTTNRLTALPPEINNCTCLETLFIGDNQLTALPEEIGNLTSLKTLVCLGNQLTSLPASLLSRRDVSVGATNNPFTRRYAEDVLAPAARHNRGLTFSIIDGTPGAPASANSLPELLTFWYGQAGKTPQEPSYWQVLRDHMGANQLKTFLERQQSTANFTKGDADHKRVFAEQLCKLLEAMVTDDDFQKKAFEELDHANTSCHDQGAFACDKLMMIYESLIGVRGKSTEEVASFALGLRRMAMIEEEAGKLGGDQIETALRLQLILKDYLKLPTTTVAMLYPSIATVDEAEALVIGERIKAATSSRKEIIAALLAQECWETRLRSLDLKYIELASAVESGTYENDDLRKADLRKRMDELYLADTEALLDGNPGFLTALSS